MSDLEVGFSIDIVLSNLWSEMGWTLVGVFFF